MIDHLIAKIVLGQIRHLIGMGAGALEAHGLITGDQNQQLVAALMAIVPIALSAWDKMQANSQANAALLAQARATEATKQETNAG